jgi:hypothetical protein
MESPILEKFGAEMVATGLVGVTTQAKALWLCYISRYLPKPQSVHVGAPSAAGKSFLAKRVMEIVPKEDVVTIDQASETAFAYMDNDDLDGKVWYVPEMTTLDEGHQNVLRLLISEQRLVRIATDVTKKSTIRLEVSGRVAVVTTSVMSLHPENETRSLLIEVPDGPDQTRAIVTATLMREAGLLPDLDPMPWLTIDRACGDEVETNGSPVIDPQLAGALAGLVSVHSTRMRRDISALTTLMKAHALLYPDERVRDVNGRLVADIRDYGVVADLLDVIFAVQQDVAIDPKVREFVQTAKSLLSHKGDGETATAKEIGALIDIDARASSRRAKKAEKGEWLVNEQKVPRAPGRYRLGNDMPADATSLPSADAVESAMSRSDQLTGTSSGQEWPDVDTDVDTVMSSVDSEDSSSSTSGETDHLATSWRGQSRHAVSTSSVSTQRDELSTSLSTSGQSTHRDVQFDEGLSSDEIYAEIMGPERAAEVMTSQDA